MEYESRISVRCDREDFDRNHYVKHSTVLNFFDKWCVFAIPVLWMIHNLTVIETRKLSAVLFYFWASKITRGLIKGTADLLCRNAVTRNRRSIRELRGPDWLHAKTFIVSNTLASSQMLSSQVVSCLLPLQSTKWEYSTSIHLNPYFAYPTHWMPSCVDICQIGADFDPKVIQSGGITRQ